MIIVRKRRQRGLLAFVGAFGAIAIVGLLVLVRELPAMRRYIRIKRM